MRTEDAALGAEGGRRDGAGPDARSVTDANTSGDAAPVDGGGTPYVWNLPTGFPVPAVPADNPMTVEKVTLGRYLFYDRQLSSNGQEACAGCHVQKLAFTDGLARAVGSTGQLHPRSAMSLANVGYMATLTWGHPFMFELERQAIVPMFGADPVELGLISNQQIEDRLAGSALYRELFAAAFPGDAAPITVGNLTRALASFERTIVSGHSPFDAYLYRGDTSAVSASALRGYALFNSEKFECFHCHQGFDLSDQTYWQDKAFLVAPFHNTALYDIDGHGAYPAPNTGVYNVTKKPEDMGKFRAPTLRNIAITAPYMHDGSIPTLDGVLDHYAAGGRTIASGPNAGVGSASPLRDVLIRPIDMTADERTDILAFFDSLTDTEFLTDPALSDPFHD